MYFILPLCFQTFSTFLLSLSATTKTNTMRFLLGRQLCSLFVLLGVACLPRTASFTFHHDLPTPRNAAASTPTSTQLSLIFQSNNDNNEYDYNAEMSEEDRMEMVRKLQKSFYTSTATTDSESDESLGEENAAAQLDESTGIFKNLPLWRVGWVEW